MGTGASSARIQQLQSHAAQRPFRIQDAEFFSDPSVIDVLKQQVLECRHHVRILNEKLALGADPNSPQIKEAVDAIRRVLRPPAPIKVFDSTPSTGRSAAEMSVGEQISSEPDAANASVREEQVSRIDLASQAATEVGEVARPSKEPNAVEPEVGGPSNSTPCDEPPTAQVEQKSVEAESTVDQELATFEHEIERNRSRIRSKSAGTTRFDSNKQTNDTKGTLRKVFRPTTAIKSYDRSPVSERPLTVLDSRSLFKTDGPQPRRVVDSKSLTPTPAIPPKKDDICVSKPSTDVMPSATAAGASPAAQEEMRTSDSIVPKAAVAGAVEENSIPASEEVRGENAPPTCTDGKDGPQELSKPAGPSDAAKGEERESPAPALQAGRPSESAGAVEEAAAAQVRVETEPKGEAEPAPPGDDVQVPLELVAAGDSATDRPALVSPDEGNRLPPADVAAPLAEPIQPPPPPERAPTPSSEAVKVDSAEDVQNQAPLGDEGLPSECTKPSVESDTPTPSLIPYDHKAEAGAKDGVSNPPGAPAPSESPTPAPSLSTELPGPDTEANRSEEAKADGGGSDPALTAKEGAPVQIVAAVKVSVLPGSSIEDGISDQGVSLAFLTAFVDAHRSALEGKTTEWVCDEFVIPATSERRCSYVDQLKREGKGAHIRTATMFVSHSWGGVFTVLVEVISQWAFERNLPLDGCFLWIDIFTVNQHINVTDFQVRTRGFREVLERIGQSLVILSPWSKPLWGSRAWCLFELLTMHLSGVKPIFLVPEIEKAEFIRTLQQDALFPDLASYIDIAQAVASNKAEEEQIKAQVATSVGFSALNDVCVRVLREWYVVVATEALNSIEAPGRLTSELQFSLAELLKALGRFEEALQMHHDRVEALGPAFGNDDERVIDTKISIALLLEKLGRSDECLGIFRECLEAKTRALGRDNPAVAAILKNIGNVLKQQGLDTEALQHYEEALNIERAALGSADVTVASTLNNISVFYDSQGLYDQALVKYEEALRIKKETLGEMHTSVAATVKNIGILFDKQGRYDEALSYYQEALRIERECLGSTHPTVAKSLHNIASVYDDQGRYDEAAALYEESLGIKRLALGDGHAGLADTLINAGVVYDKQGRYDEALARYDEAVQIQVASLGPAHASVGTTKDNMAIVLQKLGRADEALALHEEALQIARAALGDRHPGVANTLFSLAAALEAQGRNEEALGRYGEALDIFRAAHGAGHASVSGTLRNVGAVLERLGRLGEALAAYEEALALDRAAAGAGAGADPAVAYSLYSVAAVLRKLGLGETARQTYRECAGVFAGVYGPDHPETLECLEEAEKVVDAGS